jgi:putative ABC transport system permease protein
VLSATAGRGAPTSINNIGSECRPNGNINNIGAFGIEVNSVDYDYMDHFGVKLVAGRYFSEDFPGDFPNAMVINEKMVRSLGFKNAQDVLGKSYSIQLNGYIPEIIGVVKNFNSSSLHNEITSQVFMTNPNWFKEFIVKVKSANMPSTINSLKEVWTKFFPQYPLNIVSWMNLLTRCINLKRNIQK